MENVDTVGALMGCFSLLFWFVGVPIIIYKLVQRSKRRKAQEAAALARQQQTEILKTEAAKLMPVEQMGRINVANNLSVFVKWRGPAKVQREEVMRHVADFLAVKPNARLEQLQDLLAPTLGVTFIHLIRSDEGEEEAVDERSRLTRTVEKRLEHYRELVKFGAQFKAIAEEVRAAEDIPEEYKETLLESLRNDLSKHVSGR